MHFFHYLMNILNWMLVQWTSKMCPFYIAKFFFWWQLHFNLQQSLKDTLTMEEEEEDLELAMWTLSLPWAMSSPRPTPCHEITFHMTYMRQRYEKTWPWHEFTAILHCHVSRIIHTVSCTCVGTYYRLAFIKPTYLMQGLTKTRCPSKIWTLALDEQKPQK